MTDPIDQPINDESVDPGPAIDEHANGGDPDPALELDPAREEDPGDDPGEDDAGVIDQPPTMNEGDA